MADKKAPYKVGEFIEFKSQNLVATQLEWQPEKCEH